MRKWLVTIRKLTYDHINIFLLGVVWQGYKINKKHTQTIRITNNSAESVRITIIRPQVGCQANFGSTYSVNSTYFDPTSLQILTNLDFYLFTPRAQTPFFDSKWITSKKLANNGTIHPKRWQVSNRPFERHDEVRLQARKMVIRPSFPLDFIPLDTILHHYLRAHRQPNIFLMPPPTAASRTIRE